MLSQRQLVVASFTFLTITSCDSSSTTKRLLLTLKCNGGTWTNATYVAYSTDGKIIASCYEEDRSHSDVPGMPPSGRFKEFDVRREVCLWDAFMGNKLMSINKGNITRSIAFFPHRQKLAGAEGNVVKIWDTITGKEELVLRGHADKVHDLDISHDGKYVTTASLDGTIKVWNTRTGACLHTLKGRPEGVHYVSFSPRAKRIAATGGDRDRDRVLGIWEWASEKQVLSIPHDFLIGKALYSPDGMHLACHRTGIYKVLKPGQIEVLNALSGKIVFRRESPSEEINCIAYSPNGAFLASGEENGMVVLRDSLTGDEVLNLTPPGYDEKSHRPARSIAFSPGGDQLAVAYSDGTVRIWDIKDMKRKNTGREKTKGSGVDLRGLDEGRDS